MNDMFIDLNSNTILRYLSEIDRMDLLMFLKSYDIQYREILNIPSDITFGTEIEFEGASLDGVIDYIIYKQDSLGNKIMDFPKDSTVNWDFEFDSSVETDINGILYGGEVISPVMINSNNTYIDLKKICKMLKEQNAYITDRTSNHLHVGSKCLNANPKYWLNFLTLIKCFEPELLMFAAGEDDVIRANSYNYARPISCELRQLFAENNNFDNLNSIKPLLTILDKTFRRKRSINFTYCNTTEENLKNTIEFRLFNGTLNENIIQNNINLGCKTLISSRSNDFDRQYVDSFDDINFTYDKRSYYTDVKLFRAFALCDIIFDKNIDKINFLKQYLGNTLKKDEKSIRRLCKL